MALAALFACLVFIIWLIVRDCRLRKSVSYAVWVPTCLLLILGSRPLSMWLAGGTLTPGTEALGTMGNQEATSLADQLFQLSVLGASLLIAYSRRVRWRKLLAANKPLLFFYLFFALSVLWSGDPFGSAKRLTKDFGLIFVILVILTEKNPMEAIRAVYFRCAAVLFPLSVLFIKYFPDLGRSYTRGGELMLTGVTTQKNSLGEIVLVFGLFLIWDSLDIRPGVQKRLWARMRWDRLVLLLMALWLLHISQSKTALLCLAIAVALAFRGRFLSSKAASKAVLFGALSVPFLMFFTHDFNWILRPIVEALGRNMTFTGRADIWEHITATTVNPLIGAGYWNFWGGTGGAAIVMAMKTPVPNAHCGYLDMYLDGGWTALALLLTVLLTSGLRLANRVTAGEFERVKFAVLIAAILYNMSESIFARLSPLWFTTLVALIDFPYLRTVATRATSKVSHAYRGALITK